MTQRPEQAWGAGGAPVSGPRRMAEIAATRAEYAALGVGATAAASGWAAATPAPVLGFDMASTPGRPPSPAVVPASPGWRPTHAVPDGGPPAWSVPNPAHAPVVTLDARLDLAVAERAGDWARVVAVNGWAGWVDARRLVPRA